MSQFNDLNFACAPLMAHLHQKSFDTPWTQQDFEQLLKLPSTKGLISENAMIVCSICGEDAEILTLCVNPQDRRKKIASQMLTEICPYLKKFQVATLFLEVNVNNTPALNLYKKCNFQQVGRRKDYYKTKLGRQDALILQKKL